MFRCPYTDLSVGVQTTVKAPFVFAGERFFDQGIIILRRRKEVKRLLFKSANEASQSTGTILLPVFRPFDLDSTIIFHLNENNINNKILSNKR